MSTSKVALRTTLGTKDKPSALAADADPRERDPNWKQKLSEMTCKFFLSDDGCKKGRLCEARHTPKDKGRKKCGSLKHRSHQCENGKPVEKKTPKTPRKEGGKPRANASTTASPAAESPSKKDKRKDGKEGRKPKNKDKDGKKKSPQRPKAREAALPGIPEDEEESKDSNAQDEQASEDESQSEPVLEEETSSDSEESSSEESSVEGAMAVITD
eukprot:6471375-Amphidinium_carterae.1